MKTAKEILAAAFDDGFYGEASIDDMVYVALKELRELVPAKITKEDITDDFGIFGDFGFESDRAIGWNRYRKEMLKIFGGDKKMSKFYFTFGVKQKHANCYIIIEAENSNEATIEMFKRYGQKWSMQYNSAKAAGVKRFNLKELSNE